MMTRIPITKVVMISFKAFKSSIFMSYRPYYKTPTTPVPGPKQFDWKALVLDVVKLALGALVTWLTGVPNPF